MENPCVDKARFGDDAESTIQCWKGKCQVKTRTPPYTSSIGDDSCGENLRVVHEVEKEWGNKLWEHLRKQKDQEISLEN